MCSEEFYFCKHCGNFIKMIKNSGVSIICCGEPMTKVETNSTGASSEKHIPLVKLEGNKVIVKIGEQQHPMTEEHSIEWTAICTNNGGQFKCFDKHDEPKAEFILNDNDEIKEVLAFCNLHGLWKANIK